MGQCNVSIGRTGAACVVACLAGACAGSVSLGADGVLGQFDELAASFDAGTGELFISAVNTIDLQSAGFVREMQSPGRSAIFSAGFVGEPNPASITGVFTLTNIGENSAEVTGQIVVTDVDGDIITMGVDRQPLAFGPGDANFMSATWWVSLESDDGYFDGPDGGQVPTGFDLDSAVLSLFIVRDPRNGSGLFHASFDDAEAATIFAIPSPAGGALVLLTGAAAARRRRTGA